MGYKDKSSLKIEFFLRKLQKPNNKGDSYITVDT